MSMTNARSKSAAQYLYQCLPIASTLPLQQTERSPCVDRWEKRPDDYRQSRLELIKAQHRKSLLERDDAKPDAPKPPLPAELDAAWDARPRSR